MTDLFWTFVVLLCVGVAEIMLMILIKAWGEHLEKSIKDQDRSG
jgi:hypothetical protein